jgi:hypothetical protein
LEGALGSDLFQAVGDGLADDGVAVCGKCGELEQRRGGNGEQGEVGEERRGRLVELLFEEEGVWMGVEGFEAARKEGAEEEEGVGGAVLDGLFQVGAKGVGKWGKGRGRRGDRTSKMGGSNGGDLFDGLSDFFSGLLVKKDLAHLIRDRISRKRKISRGEQFLVEIAAGGVSEEGGLLNGFFDRKTKGLLQDGDEFDGRILGGLSSLYDKDDFSTGGLGKEVGVEGACRPPPALFVDFGEFSGDDDRMMVKQSEGC